MTQTMSSLATFLNSPLARHPGLLLRKVGQRMGWYRENGPLPRPTATAVNIPLHFKRELQRWIAASQLTGKTHSFSRVFDRDFDEVMLLKLCEDGPNSEGQDLTSDIKLIWDFSRAHPLFLNACANPSDAKASVAFIERWLRANANTDGPAWICAMDVAIRAVNWIAADAMSDGELGRSVGTQRWAEELWRHGSAVWRRLESRTIPSNHYLADLLGLLVVGSIFPNDAAATRWHRFAKTEFPQALLAQTRTDGGLNEASLRYHAFVTEMALVARLVHGGQFPETAERRLESMCQVVADFRESSGDVFPFGDDDSGRVLALDHASSLGRADVLLRLAEIIFDKKFISAGEATYPKSGWWIERRADWTIVSDFGGVGLHGHGSHAHSDDLSFCLEWKGQPLIVDPGSYAYTWNPGARNRFRSISSHNTVIVDGNDPLAPSNHLFFLPGRDEPWPYKIGSDGSRIFERQLPNKILHRRSFRFGTKQEVIIEDELEGEGTHDLECRLHFDPRWTVTKQPGGFLIQSGDASRLKLAVSQTDPELSTTRGEFSPAYGQVTSCVVATIKQRVALPARCQFVFQPE